MPAVRYNLLTSVLPVRHYTIEVMKRNQGSDWPAGYQQFPLWGKSQVVAAISQSRRALYAEKQTRFGNRGYKTGIAGRLLGWEIEPPKGVARTIAEPLGGGLSCSFLWLEEG